MHVCVLLCVFVCAWDPFVFAYTEPGLQEHGRKNNFDRFSSRPRRGTLVVTTTLHWREKSEGRFVIAKSGRSKREGGEQDHLPTCLPVSIPAFLCATMPTSYSSVHPSTYYISRVYSVLVSIWSIKIWSDRKIPLASSFIYYLPFLELNDFNWRSTKL